MMVLFVSQCEKKALAKTRRVLDAFADRIGDNTWQTIITMEGLQAVRKLLGKTASKSTAVSCHWIRSRSRSELLWIVGNKRKFNEKGIVPVNYTDKNIDQFMDKELWQSLPIIKSAAALAALFHDFGKANILFQEKLRGKSKRLYEPVRHEWISLRIFQAFVGEKTDEDWLLALTDISKNHFDNIFKDGLDGGINNALDSLPPLAELVAWLILSHHKLPMKPSWKKGIESEVIPKGIGLREAWFNNGLSVIWNSYNFKDSDSKDFLEDNWSFNSEDLPYRSTKWRLQAIRVADEALRNIQFSKGKNILHDEVFTSHIARLALMLSDHFYSAQNEVRKIWQSPNYNVFANTDRKTRQLKQQLDEHLIGVSVNAEKIVAALPRLESSLIGIKDNKFLENLKITDTKFAWQVKSQKLVKKVGELSRKQGFLGINMASTGRGKTLANAKIIYALKDKDKSCRFTVALGLRTLTLQTGQEYREQLCLNDRQLAIVVGGIATKILFENEEIKESPEDSFGTGSKSGEDILDSSMQIDYDFDPVDHSMHFWTKHDQGIEKILQAPVLVCTIDHLIPATEGVKGGRQIGPMLRLLTSDLIIDEPDDFSLEDLPALCRLIYWAAMLGSRVLLSTATMPPDLVFAAYQAYKAGWAEYAKVNIADWNGKINCAWFDEREEGAVYAELIDFQGFRSQHERYVEQRVKYLKNISQVKHKGAILENFKSSKDIYQDFAKTILKGALELHSNNFLSLDKKQVSIGLVRMANINPMVAVTKEFLNLNLPPGTHIHVCVYHGNYPLAIRSYLENRLDSTLKRKGNWPPKDLLELVENTEAKDQIFIVFASPVAEVGRDHDYDWAIVEPSSMRSIIQIAGRVLRHREKTVKNNNILLINENIKQLKSAKRCFLRPGFELESLGLQMDFHYLKNGVLKDEQYKNIDAVERIVKSKEKANSNLVALEHRALFEQLFKSLSSAKLWWKEQVHWCGVIQKKQAFRKSKKDEALYLVIEDNEPKWIWKNEAVFPAKFGSISGSGFDIKTEKIVWDNKNITFVFNLDAENIYKELAEKLAMDLEQVSKMFGELRLAAYSFNNVNEYNYSEFLGVYKEVR